MILSLASRNDQDGISYKSIAPQLADTEVTDKNSKEYPKNQI